MIQLQSSRCQKFRPKTVFEVLLRPESDPTGIGDAAGIRDDSAPKLQNQIRLSWSCSLKSSGSFPEEHKVSDFEILIGELIAFSICWNSIWSPNFERTKTQSRWMHLGYQHADYTLWKRPVQMKSEVKFFRKTKIFTRWSSPKVGITKDRASEKESVSLT